MSSTASSTACRATWSSTIWLMRPARSTNCRCSSSGRSVRPSRAASDCRVPRRAHRRPVPRRARRRCRCPSARSGPGRSECRARAAAGRVEPRRDRATRRRGMDGLREQRDERRDDRRCRTRAGEATVGSAGRVGETAAEPRGRPMRRPARRRPALEAQSGRGPVLALGCHANGGRRRPRQDVGDCAGTAWRWCRRRLARRSAGCCDHDRASGRDRRHRSVVVEGGDAWCVEDAPTRDEHVGRRAGAVVGCDGVLQRAHRVRALRVTDARSSPRWSANPRP